MPYPLLLQLGIASGEPEVTEFSYKLGYSTLLSERYRVIHKKLSHKTEDKMQEKMKMILQADENLAHL